MGQPDETSAQLHELVRGQAEPRWAGVVDACLAAVVAVWVLVLATLDPGDLLRVVVPVVLAAVVVVRVVVLVEHAQRPRGRGADLASSARAGERTDGRARAA